MINRQRANHWVKKKAAIAGSFFDIWLRLLGSNQRPND